MMKILNSTITGIFWLSKFISIAIAGLLFDLSLDIKILLELKEYTLHREPLEISSEGKNS